jgi:hypothetical protein
MFHKCFCFLPTASLPSLIHQFMAILAIRLRLGKRESYGTGGKQGMYHYLRQSLAAFSVLAFGKCELI